MKWVLPQRSTCGLNIRLVESGYFLSGEMITVV